MDTPKIDLENAIELLLGLDVYLDKCLDVKVRVGAAEVEAAKGNEDVAIWLERVQGWNANITEWMSKCAAQPLCSSKFVLLYIPDALKVTFDFTFSICIKMHSSLCRVSPFMPRYSLSNGMWGGLVPTPLACSS